MAKALTSDLIRLKDVRLSFARLFKAKAFQEGQDPRFEATFLLDPTNPAHAEQIKEIRQAAAKLAKAKWGEIPEDLKKCYGLADEDPKKKKYDGYPGMFYLITANTQRPTVCNRLREAVVEGQPQCPYSGCYVNTNVTLWTQDNKFGKAIRANLRIVQFVKDGKAFSGSAPANAEDEFEALNDAPGGKGGATSVDDDEL